MKRSVIYVLFQFISILLLLICVRGDVEIVHDDIDHTTTSEITEKIITENPQFNDKLNVVKRSHTVKTAPVQKIKNIKLSDIKESIKNVSDELVSNTKSNIFKEKDRKDNIRARQSSLVFVFDATGSMSNDLVELRKGAALIVEAMTNRPVAPIYNYVLVPYRDPEVGPVMVTTNSTELLESLEHISVYGGGDCPEMSLSAITWAINASLPYSYVYVFTDASAKDHALVGSILQLVQRKKSQVVFVLTGDCNDRTNASYQVYHQIAVASSGQVFNLKKNEVSQVLQYVEDTLDTNLVNLGSSVNPPGYDYEQNVSVDDTLKKVTVSVSGDTPQLSIRNPLGEIIDSPPRVVPTLSLSKIKVYNIINPEPGKWTITVGSTDKHSVKVSGVSGITFDYGFFINDTDKIHETTNRPLRDNENQLLIDVKEGIDDIKILNTVDILNSEGKFLFEIPLEKVESPSSNKSHLYKTIAFLPPEGFFYFAIIVPLHGNVTLRCMVESLAPATAWWFRNKIPIQSKQHFSQSGIAEFEIIDVNENYDGLYICRASNSAGISSAKTSIIVTGSHPLVTLLPYNPEVETDTKFIIECRVESELQIMDVQIYFSDKNSENENRILYPLIRSKSGNELSYSYEITATSDTEGIYSCEATNKMGKTEGVTYVKILPPLIIEVLQKVVKYQTGENVTLVCKIEGSKYGKWIKIGDIDESCCNKYVSESYGKDNVTLTLNIPNSSKDNEGIYMCTAHRDKTYSPEAVPDNNDVNANVTMIYVEKTKLLNEEQKIKFVHEGEDVTLGFMTTGIPKPSTTWMLPNGIELSIDNPTFERFTFQNDNELHISKTERTDGGDYIARAKNPYAEVTNKIKIIIWKQLEFVHKMENTTVKIQDSIDLQCEIEGYPVPEVTWYFDDEIVEDNLSNDNMILHIGNVSLNNAGLYVCIAENLREKIVNEAYLDVIATKPDISLSPQNGTLRPGKDIFIECTVESELPIVSVEIYFESQQVNESTSKVKLSTTNIINEDTIRYYSNRLITSQETAGLYSCIATNLAGYTQEDVILKVLPVMNATIVPEVFEYEYGETISLSCNVTGTKNGSWEIPNFDRQLKEENSLESTGDVDWVHLTIFIENATELNAGTYLCIGFRGESDDKEIVNTTVEARLVEKPKIQATNSSMTAEINSTIILNCRATGIPVPIINWFLPDGIKVDSNDTETDRLRIHNENQLIIKNINESDDGKYKCVAENHLGTAEDTIDVSTWSKPFFTDALNNASVNIYDNVNLTCSIDGIPKPDIVWYHESNEMLSYNSSDGNKTLVLKNVRISDGGKYSCFGQNLHGSITADAHLEITGLVSPVLLKSNDSFIVREGDRIEVVCRFSEGKPYPKLFWQKDNANISKAISIEAIDNVKIYNDEENHDSKIVIESVELKNDGNYTCVGFNSIGVDRYNFYLDVHTVPRFTNIYQITNHADQILNDETVETTAGDMIALRCVSMGKPKPMITWSKDNTPLSYSDIIYTENNDSLIISKTEEVDAGAYTCHAENPVGFSEKKITLIVLVKPLMLNATLDPVIQKIEGQMVILPCPVYGLPPPDVKWFIDDKVIVPSDHMQVDINNTLRFVANLTDLGVYQCTAINKVGNVSQEYLLLIFSPPSIYPKGDEIVQISRGSPTTLECHTVGFPMPIIRWVKNGDTLKENTTEIIMNDSGRLDITNVTRNNSGIYTCNAENNAGLSQKMFNIIIKDPPVILESDISRTIELLRGKEEFNMPCQANGNPSPDISWLRNGKVIVNDFHSQVKSDGTLSLKFLTENLSGIYTCQATNSEGTIAVDYDLKIITPPALIGENDRNVIAVEGTDAVLECPIKPTLIPPKVEWYKDSELMNVNKNEMQLLLNNVSRHDVKTYSCLASNAMGSVMAKFNIIIHWPPSLLEVNNNETHHVHLFEGDLMKLTCDVDANPEADIRWMKDLDMIGEVSSVLERKDVKTHHGGDHICIASNVLGHIKKTFKIHVSAMPKIEGPDVENIEVRLGREAKLECNAYGVPKPDIKWNPKYAADWTAIGNGDVLKSFNVTKKSEGIYICEATNSVGSITKSFNLTVLELPKIDYIQTVDEDNNTYNQSKDIFVREGSTIRISCFSNGNPSPYVQWIRNGLIHNETLINESHLTLSNVSKKDGGRYTCIAANKTGSDENDVYIEVLALPQFLHDKSSDENSTKVIKVRENQRITLNCQVDGNPPPDIYWFKDKKYMGFYDSVLMTQDHAQLLLINKISEDHSGKYMCVARNKVGENKKHFQINVITPPVNERAHYEKPLLIVKKGQDVYLECPISGNPKPTIRWMKDPFYEVFENEHTNILPEKTSSKLIINNATILDSGNYSCIMTNEVGSAEITYSVEILEPPTIVFEVNKLQKVNEEGVIIAKIRRGFELFCNATGYPEPKITWYKDGKLLVNDLERESLHISLDNHYLNVMDVLVTDSGKYTCSADNIAGSVNHEFKVKVLGVRGVRDLSDKASSEKNKIDDIKNNAFNLSDEFLDESSCHGNNTETKQCMIKPCKIDGGWSDWGDWTNCTNKCGQGIKMRARNCTNPTPRYGGNLCDGLNKEQAVCNGTECSLWFPWSPWSGCSVTCGRGTKKRYRDCRGPVGTCLGHSTETTPCNYMPCEVDGGWSAWGPWGSCSASCGSSQQKRTRQCNSPAPRSGGKACKGGNLQIRSCIGIPSCDNLDRNAYDRTKPGMKKAHFSIKGKVNGNSLATRYTDVDVDEKDGHQYATASLQQLVAVKDNYLPYVTFTLSPDAVDKTQLVNQTNRSVITKYSNPAQRNHVKSRSTQIEFATGEKLVLIQRKQRLSKSGELDYEIIVDGTIPEDRQASIKKINTDSGIQINNGCSSGFGYNPKSGVCEDVNECKFAINDCHNTQMCENTIGSYKCFCETGYMSLGTGKRCLDINECVQNIDGCSHECINIPGSFYCNCPSAFRLLHDKKTCEQVINISRDRAFIVVAKDSDKKKDFDSDEDVENILLTRISPKRDKNESLNYRPTRPHKHHLDYDYNYDKTLKLDDDYEDYAENEFSLRETKPVYNKRIASKINTTINFGDALKNSTKSVYLSDDCPSGYFKNLHRCEDIDECKMNKNTCNNTINICINTQGSYMCIPTPCPNLYQKSSNSVCIRKCSETRVSCSQNAIVQQSLRYISLSITKSAVSHEGILFDLDYGGTLNKTKYSLESQLNGDIYEIRTLELKGMLLIKRLPLLNRLHRVIVEGYTYDDGETMLLYYNKFIIYIYVLE